MITLILLMALVHLCKVLFVLFYKHAYNLVKHTAAEFSYFVSDVNIINVFIDIFVPEVISKARVIKTKHTKTTF